MDQIDSESCDPNFKPPYLVGCPEILDPYNDVLLPSYGITDREADDRILTVYRRWRKDNGVSGGRSTVEVPGG
jgi:hypothetical protein